jgi:hypothetical protein
MLESGLGPRLGRGGTSGAQETDLLTNKDILHHLWRKTMLKSDDILIGLDLEITPFDQLIPVQNKTHHGALSSESL